MDKEPTNWAAQDAELTEEDLLNDEVGIELHFGRWTRVPGTHKAIMSKGTDPAGHVRVRTLKRLEGFFLSEPRPPGTSLW